MAILLYFADLATKCLFQPILGRFLGVDTLNVVGYYGDLQKSHPWPKTRVLTYRSSRWVKKCDLRACWKKQKKKKKEWKETQRFDKSHICPDHPRCATSIKVVLWGGVPDVVNHAKFYQNRFKGFNSLRGRNLPFSMANITGYCYRPNCDGILKNIFWWFCLSVYCFLVNADAYNITVCTVVQNCCKGRSKKYRKWHFRGVAAKKPLNRLTQNLACVITSGTRLSTPNGMLIGSGAWPPRRGEMLMVCTFFCLFISAARGQTAGPILTLNVSKHVFLKILHSFVG